MPTRFYLPTTAQAAPVSPAFGSQWNNTGSASRRKTSTTKANTPTTDDATPLTVGSTATTNRLSHQWVSDPIGAQTISGTLSAVVICAESATSANASLQVVVRVVSNDGSTERGVLYAGHAAANNSTSGTLGHEMGTSAQTRIIPSGTALSSVTTQDGDRIVIEMGARFNNSTGTTQYVQFRLGDPSATSDLALTASQTPTGAPWVELSPTIDPAGSDPADTTKFFLAA